MTWLPATDSDGIGGRWLRWSIRRSTQRRQRSPVSDAICTFGRVHDVDNRSWRSGTDPWPPRNQTSVPVARPGRRSCDRSPSIGTRSDGGCRAALPAHPQQGVYQR